jgi:type VI secretion system protein VasJ
VDVGCVIELAETLLTHRCKDLRVASYYVWARLHRDGEVGLGEGLNLLAALVERYPDAVLPTRPNSRKMALEWLTSAKVLDSLALFPEVDKNEAQQTVAALVWLEDGLAAWPQDQRPGLDALYGALAARLKQSGGVDALVPQHSASHESSASSEGSARAIKSGRELLDTGRKLVSYLCDQPQGWLAAHRLMKSLRWDTVHEAPLQEANGSTRLAPPRSDYRAHLKRLYVQQNWTELLDQTQRIFSEGVNHFWLDLQWYVYQALSKQPAPQDSWATIVALDLGVFLERLPGVETLCWADGSPFASTATREWIDQQVSDSRPQSWMPAPSIAVATTDSQIFALEAEALAQADSTSVEQALHWLIHHPDAQQNGRLRWLVRLLMARVAEQYGKGELAFHMLTELDAVAEKQALAHWEPELSFEVKARLLKALRLKAQRNDADKADLHKRMEITLAALVMIDPVRAAVLCS